MFEDLSYEVGDRSFGGWLAHPKKRPRRGVLLLHGGRGLGDHERERAARLVGLGYLVYAPNLFEPFADRDAAMKAIEALASDAVVLRARLGAAFAILSARVETRFAVGHCFGGLAALELGRSGADVRAVVPSTGI